MKKYIYICLLLKFSRNSLKLMSDFGYFDSYFKMKKSKLKFSILFLTLLLSDVPEWKHRLPCLIRDVIILSWWKMLYWEENKTREIKQRRHHRREIENGVTLTIYSCVISGVVFSHTRQLCVQRVLHSHKREKKITTQSKNTV